MDVLDDQRELRAEVLALGDDLGEYCLGRAYAVIVLVLGQGVRPRLCPMIR